MVNACGIKAVPKRILTHARTCVTLTPHHSEAGARFILLEIVNG
jgi:hypothetical protein